jgi:hypothetical protein
MSWGLDVKTFQPALLREPGVKSSQFRSQHSKTVCVDRSCALVGSANITHHSLTVNQEVCILTRGDDVVQKLTGIFDRLWEEALPLTQNDVAVIVQNQQDKSNKKKVHAPCAMQLPISDMTGINAQNFAQQSKQNPLGKKKSAVGAASSSDGYPSTAAALNLDSAQPSQDARAGAGVADTVLHAQTSQSQAKNRKDQQPKLPRP